MGEAKRRKQLDPNWGKSKEISVEMLTFADFAEKTSDSESVEYFQNRTMDLDDSSLFIPCCLQRGNVFCYAIAEMVDKDEKYNDDSTSGFHLHVPNIKENFEIYEKYFNKGHDVNEEHMGVLLFQAFAGEFVGRKKVQKVTPQFQKAYE